MRSNPGPSTVLLCAAALLLGVAGAARAEPSDDAPRFVGLRLDGGEFDSAELGGGYVLLDFWGAWCPPCIGAFPKLSRLHRDFSKRGFQVVGLAVLSGTPEEVAEFIADYDVAYPIVVVEREVADAFDVLAYPAYFLVGPGGEILRRYPGQPTDLYEIVARDLERFLDTPRPSG